VGAEVGMEAAAGGDSVEVLAPLVAVRRIDELEVKAFVRQRVVGKGDAIHGTHLREGFLQQIRPRFP